MQQRARYGLLLRTAKHILICWNLRYGLTPWTARHRFIYWTKRENYQTFAM